MQAPGADRFTYQYQLSLNGKSDTIEIWKNDPTTAKPIDFSPIFHDDAETKAYSTPWKTSTLKLARSLSDGSNDYFLDFAFPISQLIAAGAIGSSSDLEHALFFPATSTNPNTFNKSYLNCPFQPYTVLDVAKSVQPAIAPANVETPVTYTIGVTNKKGKAYGVTISDVALPSFLSNVQVGVATNDGSATYTVVSANPLLVKLPKLYGGKTVTVTIKAKAKPGCSTPDFTNTATVGAANALEKSASALLDVKKATGAETCDGVDNDCDGSSDEGSLCNDGNPCTADACKGKKGCAHTPILGCTPCSTPSDCPNDGNACTMNTCSAGVCGVANVPACTPCATPGDCGDDGNACTNNTCTGGVCGMTTTPGCTPCTTSSDCGDDGNACTHNTCTGGACGMTTTPGCTPCATPGDCGDDGNACTNDTCTGGVCGLEMIPSCEPCTTPADCTDDHNACTNATCQNGMCGTMTIADCKPCMVAADCNDENPCTTETCHEGTCQNTPVEGCVPCETDADCDDDQGCTSDVCGPDGSCRITTIEGCVPCETDTECEDDDRCTTDTCVESACTHQTVEQCGPEVCTDGVDNDGDGDVDCADSDCAEDPSCRTEICGNCLDDDGDGLVDYEDQDCCDNTLGLVLRKMRVRTKPVVGKNRLRLRAQYAPRAPEGFDPSVTGATLQLRDAEGDFFCQKIPFKTDPKWARMGIFWFRDKSGQMASGIRRSRFTIKKKQNDRLMFSARGKKMSFRDVVGTDVTVTVAVGNQCTTQTARLRSKKNVKKGAALVFKRPKGK
jgi:hypothetical protein